MINKIKVYILGSKGHRLLYTHNDSDEHNVDYHEDIPAHIDNLLLVVHSYLDLNMLLHKIHLHCTVHCRCICVLKSIKIINYPNCIYRVNELN